MLRTGVVLILLPQNLEVGALQWCKGKNRKNRRKAVIKVQEFNKVRGNKRKQFELFIFF